MLVPAWGTGPRQQQLPLFANRTSAAPMRTNQLWLYFSAFTAILLTILRRVGLQRGLEFANALWSC